MELDPHVFGRLGKKSIAGAGAGAAWREKSGVGAAIELCGRITSVTGQQYTFRGSQYTQLNNLMYNRYELRIGNF